MTSLGRLRSLQPKAYDAPTAGRAHLQAVERRCANPDCGRLFWVQSARSRKRFCTGSSCRWPDSVQAPPAAPGARQAARHAPVAAQRPEARQRPASGHTAAPAREAR